jgi:hypothetical protein
MNNKIFQIYYNDLTKKSNDKGFLQLDNTSNIRKDWSEYWPIRNYLLDNKLDDNIYYAFFSPKFHEKTGLNSEQVNNILSKSDEDVVSFSPFFDQSAFFLNIFYQGAANHPSIFECFEKVIKFLDDKQDVNQMVMTSKNTIFCNFFAAKKHVWIEWFNICERIYEVAENNNTNLANLLNSNVIHSQENYPAKVFVMERIISLLLILNDSLKIKAVNPLTLPFTSAQISNYKNYLIILDALKISFKETNMPETIEIYLQMRSDLLKQ